MSKLFFNIPIVAIQCDFQTRKYMHKYMKQRFLILTMGLLFAALAGAAIINDSEEQKNTVLMQLIKESLSRQHFSPQKMNDDWSAKVFDEYINRLDFSKRFFLKEDIERLKAYRKEIDDLVEEEDYALFELSTDLLKTRIAECEKFYEGMLDKPFDFSVQETIELDKDKMDYAKDKADIKARWAKMFKHQTLSRLVDKVEEQKKAKEENDTTVTIKPFEELEIDAREKVLKNYKNWFKRLDKVDDKDRMATYINSIVNTYDDHTGYFPPKDKEDFDIRLSGKLEGIGATLQEKDGYINVVRIVPGSACSLQGELEENDMILKVAQGAEEPVDVVDMRLDEAVQLIRGKKGTEVRLSVKKVDGTNKIIPIIRDVVVLEETYAKSAILEKEGKKIGYIKLPKFYADFNSKEGRNCSDDVRKEIIKLQEENVEGLVLDLRSNGGGSLKDVVSMTGMFIDEGPVVQIKARKGKPYILEDEEPGVLYEEPLVILINSFSASASEIMAAAIQDYKRGIIIGSKTSYGKGTVQRFYDLDQYIVDDSDGLKPLGALKITTQKFFRIDGRSTQLKGVTPDIILPDGYTYIETGEKEKDFALPWDEIEPVPYAFWDKEIDMEDLKSKSERRVNKNKTFSMIDENAQRRKRNKDLTEYNLEFETYTEEFCQRQEEADKYKDLQGKALKFDVFALKADLLEIADDTIKQNTSKEWREKLQKDAYLEEALSVIQDAM